MDQSEGSAKAQRHKPRRVSTKNSILKKGPIQLRRRHSSRRNVHRALKPEREPGPSCVSFKSNMSKEDILVDFKSTQPSAAASIHQTLKPEPGPSCVSFKSDEDFMNFKLNKPFVAKRLQKRLTPEHEPDPSCVSFRSNMSKKDIIDLKPSAAPTVDQQTSEVPSGPSAQRPQTQLDSIFTLLEENIVAFVKNELKKIQRTLSPDYPECPESQREDEGEGEEKRSREAFVKITQHFLRRMRQEELAERLQSKPFTAVCQRSMALPPPKVSDVFHWRLKTNVTAVYRHLLDALRTVILMLQNKDKVDEILPL